MDHDGLYKALLNEFFLPFIRLFFPDLAQQIEPDSIKEKEQELLTDLQGGQTNRVDILREVRLKERASLILILVEPQSYDDKEFGERLFRYFTRLYDKYRLPIFPVALLSYQSPKTTAPNIFRVGFEGFTAITFNYAVIQLNQLNWQDFADVDNLVACALMAQMQVARKDRPKAKLTALNQLAELNLNPAQVQMVSGFIDSYLPLNEKQQTEFNQEFEKTNLNKKEAVMQIVTSWMREGIAQGKVEGELNIISKQLTWRYGPLTMEEEAQLKTLKTDQLENLAEAFLDFKDRSDLTAWLEEQNKSVAKPKVRKTTKRTKPAVS